jgi:GrpB-like predicted nucleotidyltransferase (UPF0157 family)
VQQRGLGLEHLTTLGTPGDRVEIVPYDPGWPMMFEQEATRIREACGHWLLAIEHIGSTAVPGLAAKPILDIMPGVDTIDDAINCIEPMAGLGYEHLGEFGIPGREFFVLKHNHRRVAHVHMFAIGCPDWHRHIVFRDLLRADSSKRQQYQVLKQELAAMYADDRERYAERKTEFIRAIQD